MRLEVLRGLPELPATEAALALASALIAEGVVPEKARTDAAHIAVAAVHGMDFLVTWNCRHIANAEMEPRIREMCVRHGWRCPEICTPEQLLPKEEEGEHSMNDPIVEEVSRIRAEIAARNGNDLRRIFEDARSRQGSNGRRVVSYDPADTVEPACVVREEPPKP